MKNKNQIKARGLAQAQPGRILNSGTHPFKDVSPDVSLTGLGACPLSERSSPVTSNERRRGFTLLEVIVTISIVVIVLGLVFASLYMTVFTSKDLIGKNKRYADLMKTYFQIRKQLLAAYSSENSEYILKAEPGTKEKGDIFYIVTADPVNFKGVVEAQYEIRKDKDNNTYLVYREKPYPGYETITAGKESEKDWTVLSKKITGLKIDCGKNNLWFTQWNDTSLPYKIRIILYYKDDDIEKKFSFITVPGFTEFEEIMNKRETEDGSQKTEN